MVDGSIIEAMEDDKEGHVLDKIIREADAFYGQEHKHNIYALLSDYSTARGYSGNGQFKALDYSLARDQADTVAEKHMALDAIKDTIDDNWKPGSELHLKVGKLKNRIKQWTSAVTEDPSKAINLPELGIEQLREEVKTKVSRMRRPFYAIAHRVLTTQGIEDALAMGANAIEIDATAWVRGGWWADWAGYEASAGNKIKDMFHKISELKRDNRAYPIFVWIDIKNPEYCKPDLWYYNCSPDKLKDMAREVLQSTGVRVLYGFSQEAARTDVFRSFVLDLQPFEAVSIDGELPKFDDVIEKGHRVMSYGDHFVTGSGFHRTQLELRNGVDSGQWDDC
ncbi:hypothetical protein CDD83_7370 [Cordyceps sp. RAO-2017]|nr:hypothetical protein CDD83_7370 [Cordyceps sp. RAO-2017]